MAAFSISQLLRQKARQTVQWSIDDLLNPSFWVEVLVEFIVCSYVLILVIFALTTLNAAAFVPTTTHFGIFAVFLVVTLLEGFGPICGALLNPVAAWAFFISGRISLARAILYMVVEVAGAATGGMIGISLTPAAQQLTFGAFVPGPGITIGMGLAIEGIVTFISAVVALCVTDPENKTSVKPSIALGFCLGANIMAAGTHTGGLGNPIITFGIAVVAKDFHMHFPVYWAGPYIGATVGAIFYLGVDKAKKVLNRQRVSLEQEQEEDTQKQNSEFDMSEMYYPDGGHGASKL